MFLLPCVDLVKILTRDPIFFVIFARLLINTVESETSLINQNFRNDGIDFENEIMWRLHELGWDTSGTPRCGDFGADIVAVCGDETMVVQCKDWNGVVGFSAVKEIHTARTYYHANHAIVVSRYGFTSQTHRFAQNFNIGLHQPNELQPGSKLDRTKQATTLREEIRELSCRLEAEKAQADLTISLDKDLNAKILILILSNFILGLLIINYFWYSTYLLYVVIFTFVSLLLFSGLASNEFCKERDIKMSTFKTQVCEICYTMRIIPKIRSEFSTCKKCKWRS